MSKTTVVRAYLFNDGQAQRVLSDSNGQVYHAGQWGQVGDGEIVTVPGVFERWVDVPATWLGHQPWWK